MHIPTPRLVLATAITVSLLTACGKEAPKPASNEVVVRIAAAGPLTGGAAEFGKDSENGVRLAIEEANGKPFTLGGKTVRFELMSEDDHSDPKLGPTIAQKLADAKVSGVVGHVTSGVAIPASAVYNQAGIPMISGSSTSPQLTAQGFNNVFRTVGRDDQQGPAMAAYLANELKVKQVAIIDDATAYGAGLADQVEKTLAAAGVKIVGHEATTDSATDFKAILTKLKGKGPDVIFYGGMDATAAPMIRQARELGINAQFAFGDGACGSNMGTLAGPAGEGLLCTQAGIPAAMAAQGFRDAFKAKFGDARQQFAPYSYDAAKILLAAMVKADSSEPAKYLPKLAETSYDGATGHIEFDARGDRKDAEMTIFRMKGGNVEPIAVMKAGKSAPVAPAGK